jgi:hypothetical protein
MSIGFGLFFWVNVHVSLFAGLPVCRFAGLAVGRLGGSPVRRFASLPVRRFDGQAAFFPETGFWRCANG